MAGHTFKTQHTHTQETKNKQILWFNKQVVFLVSQMVKKNRLKHGSQTLRQKYAASTTHTWHLNMFTSGILDF